MSEIIFTRPGTKCELKERLLEDIKNAKFRIYLAMAYFTDEDIYNAMKESTAQTALFILNESDLKNDKGRRSCSYDLIDKYDCHTVVLGDKGYSKMHHKFIILDNIAYIGSYNFSYPASNQSWEFMFRVTDANLVKKIEEEFWAMWLLGGSNSLKGSRCDDCHTILVDPFEHYTLEVNFNIFETTIDPRKYVTTICKNTDEICSCCNKAKARVIMVKDKKKRNYCFKCTGNEFNDFFINSQMGWESDNIYYDELAIWYQEDLGESLLDKCGKCGMVKPLALVSEIIRGRKRIDDPYGIDIGPRMNICEECYKKDFLTAYIMNT
ncbi:phospholipase D-like domain-containing protein [Bacillus toyonensis]